MPFLDATNVNTEFREAFLQNLPLCTKTAAIFYISPDKAYKRIMKDIKNKKDRSNVPEQVVYEKYGQFLHTEKNIIKNKEIYDFLIIIKRQKWTYYKHVEKIERKFYIIHREDGPALIYSNGEKWWYLNGLLHRKNGPTIITSGGTQQWHLNGLKHRIDGPAIIYSHGDEMWYLNNKIVDGEIYKKIENSSKEELLMYMVLSKYKNYLSLIEYRLNIL